MAITGNSDELYKANLSMNASSYNTAVGGLQGEVVKDQNAWATGDDTTSGWWLWKETNEGNRTASNYNDSTVQGSSGAYVLKGRAGVTPQFYTAFSDAFDEYKGVIKTHLKDLETNPDIHQAFSGTEIEGAVKRLIEAVETEAYDYLFKLEQAEKTVINSVQAAFKKQQEKMAGSMNTDTKKLSEGNTKKSDMDAFAKKDVSWGGTPDSNSGKNYQPINNVPAGNRNLTY